MTTNLTANSMTETAIRDTHKVISRSALATRLILGSLMGLTWGASLRAWMVVLALKFGERPQTSWSGTFLAILLPAALMGALLGWATYDAETSDRNRWRWAVLFPLILAVIPAIVIKDFIAILIESGLGGGAIAVALIGVLGGYTLSGFGPKWTRWITGVLAIAFTLAFSVGLFWVDDTVFGMPDAGEMFGSLLFILLMGMLSAGVSMPARYSNVPRQNEVPTFRAPLSDFE